MAHPKENTPKKERPAFHVDPPLRKAAAKAAEAFMEEEEELKKLRICKDLKANTY